MSQKNSLIIIVIVSLVALGGLYFLTKKNVQAPPVDFAVPITTADKEAILNQLAASSTTPVPAISKQKAVLRALEASSTPVSVSEEQKIKILEMLQNNSR
jgi:hypothetical protein